MHIGDDDSSQFSEQDMARYRSQALDNLMQPLEEGLQGNVLIQAKRRFEARIAPFKDKNQASILVEIGKYAQSYTRLIMGIQKERSREQCTELSKSVEALAGKKAGKQIIAAAEKVLAASLQEFFFLSLGGNYTRE